MKILALSHNAWDGPWMNRQQLLSRIARRHGVLYSTGLWRVWDRRLPEWRAAPLFGAIDRDHGVHIDQPPRLLLRFPDNPRVDRSMIALGQLRWKARLRRMAGGPTVLHVFHPEFWPIVRGFDADRLVYHAYDLYSATPGWNDELDRFQRKLLERADLVIASSAVTAQSLQRECKTPVVVLPNGADYDAFSGVDLSVEAPRDLAAIPHPRIGYTGQINRKVDLDLMLDLAQRRPAWQFVVIGGVGRLDTDALAVLDQLRARPNVHLLGHKQPTELPEYVARMDVNLMVYRVDGSVWTAGIYPLKLHEYLAAGQPVVSADVPAVRQYADVVSIAHDAGQWLEAIERTLVDTDPVARSRRRQVARQNSWDIRAAELERLLTALSAPPGMTQPIEAATIRPPTEGGQ